MNLGKIRRFLAPNRVVAYLTVGAGAATAAATVLQDTDATSTTGIVVGYLGATAAAIKWLDGWQKHEASERGDYTGGVPPMPTPDEA
jgi:hypothetical protein